MADAAQETGNLFHDLLSEVIPYPIFRILAGFSNLIYSLLGSANNPASWTSTLLPPLITFFLAYFALVTAYRTVRSMLALAWFGIKWGAIIGGLIAIWAWWTDNTDAISSTGTVPGRGGFFGQLNSLGPLMNTLYTQLPDLTNPDTFTSSRGGDRRNRRSSSSSSSSQARRRTRSSTRANQRAFDFTNDDTYLPDDLGAGFGAFADMLGRSNDQESWNGGGGGGGGGVDFASLLRTLVTEGQRQGIDALSALRAAGRVQDELRSFQSDPSAWFEGVSERFRTSSGTPEVAGAGAGRSATTGRTMRSRSRAGAGGINAQPADSWWSNLNDFFVKREPSQQQQHDSRSRTRRRRRNAPPPSSFDDDAYHDDDDDYNV